MLGGFSGGCKNFQALGLGVDTQGGDDARGQAQGTQVGRRKGRTHALVVGGGVRMNPCAALEVQVFAAKAAEVGALSSGHGKEIIRM